tara:strand:- start:49 stop:339 length:291 start_codon:yes stop_codon:yes gene_type:complete
MIKVGILYADLIDHYCFVCGTKNFGKEGLEKVCDHLVYVGADDGDAMYDKLKLHKESNVDKSPGEIIEELDDDYIGFYTSPPAQKVLQAYIVYKIK